MKKIPVLLCGILLSIQGFSQKIVGRIVDENGKPISNVEVFIEGDTTLTYSNYLGFFEIPVNNNKSSLLAAHVSYSDVKVEIGDQEKILIPMKRQATQPIELLIKGFREEQTYPITGKELDEHVDFRLVGRDTVFLVNNNAKFYGGVKGLFNYIGTNFILNNADSITGEKVSIFFTVEKSGKVVNVKCEGDTLQGVGEQLKSLFLNMPNWTPAKQRNSAIDQDQQLEIVYGTPIYLKVEQSASFPGGMQAFYEYVGRKMTGKYPAKARRVGIEGKVFVEFVVEADGSIDPKNVAILKGIGGGCDELAASVMMDSPPWNPGTQRGKPIRQRMVIPIFFKLN